MILLSSPDHAFATDAELFRQSWMVNTICKASPTRTSEQTQIRASSQGLRSRFLIEMSPFEKLQRRGCDHCAIIAPCESIPLVAPEPPCLSCGLVSSNPSVSNIYEVIV